ncbi:MAG: toprim domain-containing protein, partial [Clostridia bacterium]|nr:toprim domain-containing protein [Clostridia bacterium]
MKPVCKKVIVVEGKYDKIRLESLLDATILTTEGFGIFKNKEKRILLKKLAEKKGIVILSDPDGAGKVIRGHLHNITGGKGITDLYIPAVFGKEKRKI